MILHVKKIIFGLIHLKHNLGMFIISFDTQTKDHPYTRGKGKERYSLRIMNVQMLGDERQM